MSLRRSILRLDEIDWDFGGDYSESPFAAIHWHPGRFASQIPAALIGLLSDPGGLILDPFMGSGTTIIEAQRLCRRSIGIDLNPIACVMVQSKTLGIKHQGVHRLIAQIKEDASGALFRHRDRLKSISRSVPPMVQSAKWYSSNVFNDLTILWGLLETYDGTKRILAEAVFSSILLPVCRETRHWGYVCDNCTPVGEKAVNVREVFAKVCDRFETAYRLRDEGQIAAFGPNVQLDKPEIICGPAVAALQGLEPRSVDLVVTSPPYYGVTDYIKTQRLSMEWFDHKIEPLRLLEVGARSKRHRKDAIVQYLNDLTSTFKLVYDVLKDGHICAVVIGESSTRDAVIAEVRGLIVSCGFVEQSVSVRRLTKQRRLVPSVLSEHVLVYSKGRIR